MVELSCPQLDLFHNETVGESHCLELSKLLRLEQSKLNKQNQHPYLPPPHTHTRTKKKEINFKNAIVNPKLECFYRFSVVKNPPKKKSCVFIIPVLKIQVLTTQLWVIFKLRWYQTTKICCEYRNLDLFQYVISWYEAFCSSLKTAYKFKKIGKWLWVHFYKVCYLQHK